MVLQYILKSFKELYKQLFCVEIDTTDYNKILIIDNFDYSYKHQLATSLQSNATVYLYDDIFNENTDDTIQQLLKKDEYIVSIQYAKNHDVPYHIDKLIDDCDLILYLNNNKTIAYLKCIYNYIWSYSNDLKANLYSIYKNYDLKHRFTYRNIYTREKTIIVDAPYYLEPANK